MEFIDQTSIKIQTPNVKKPFHFSFDRIFDMNSRQEEVFDVAAKPIINSIYLTKQTH